MKFPKNIVQCFEELKMNDIPVLIFCYKRLPHLVAVVDSLRKNSESKETNVIFYSDGPRNREDEALVEEVRDYLAKVDGFKDVKIISSQKNKGLSRSIIDGVTEALNIYGSCIVLEDDIVVSKDFLAYMNNALAVYKDREDIFSVSGYNYPNQVSKYTNEDVFLAYRSSSWGWGTWNTKWAKVDWEMNDYANFIVDETRLKKFKRGGEDLLNYLKMKMNGEIDSWSIVFDYAHFKENGLCLYPVYSKVKNIGFDGTGQHCGVSEEFDVEINEGSVELSYNININLPIIY